MTNVSDRRESKHTTNGDQRRRGREGRCDGAYLREDGGDRGVRAEVRLYSDVLRGERWWWWWRSLLLLVRRVGRVVVLATKHRRGGFGLLEAPGADGGGGGRGGGGALPAAKEDMVVVVMVVWKEKKKVVMVMVMGKEKKKEVMCVVFRKEEGKREREKEGGLFVPTMALGTVLRATIGKRNNIERGGWGADINRDQ